MNEIDNRDVNSIVTKLFGYFDTGVRVWITSLNH